MSVQVTCGQCQGQLTAEATGVVVACPHCGSHLEIPEGLPPAGPISPLVLAGETPLELPVRATGPAPSSVTDAIAALDSSENRPVMQPDDSGLTALEDPSSTVHESPQEGQLGLPPLALEVPAPPTGDSFPAFPDSFEVPEAVPAAPPSENLFGFLAAGSTTASADALPVPEPAVQDKLTEPGSMFPVVVDAPVARPSVALDRPVSEPAGPGRTSDAPAGALPADVVPRKQFLIVVSYASLVTLLLLYVLFLRPARTSQLESLPDLKPPVLASGEIGMSVARPEAEVAPGHVLHLGESRRFGNVRVTPVRVTHGPVAFRHFDAASKSRRDPSAAVLKLWLKLENVSRDQTFAPLDRLVVYKRSYGDGGGHVRSNALLGLEQERRKGTQGTLYYHFPLPEESEWLIDGQTLEEPLPPGGLLETFIPSEELAEVPDGKLFWRVLLRKGYNPESHRGVLTLFDVRFGAEEVVQENGAAS